MTLAPLLTALENTPWALAISEGSYLFPAIETLHVIALTAVFGSILVLDLRLLGVFAHHRRVTRLARELLPLTWVAFGLAVATGTLMFASAATRYAGNTPFQIKVVLLLLAGLNMAAFHGGAFRRVQDWDEAQRTPPAARLAGAASLTLWIGVIAAGRFIGFTDVAGP
ncbi:hypothetical protein LJR225_000012 [Phenylobacterium sp. LjRoot225]|uniref:DUF6644 family protein n=1 Tax=Phenylobacterium sp. LjRoot225 TaxID=3342285 RepID=UPI003ECDBEDE